MFDAFTQPHYVAHPFVKAVGSLERAAMFLPSGLAFERCRSEAAKLTGRTAFDRAEMGPGCGSWACRDRDAVAVNHTFQPSNELRRRHNRPSS